MNETRGMHPAFDFEPEAELDAASIKGDWQAKAALGELLILSFSYPDRPLTITVTLGDYVTAARNIAGDTGIELPEEFTALLEGYEGTPDTELLEKLRKEYKRLFGGENIDGIISPYESDWCDSAEGEDVSVAKFYQSCGLMTSPDQGDPLDHLEAEIEFLEFVALAQVGLVETNPNAPVGPDGYGDAYERFIEKHAARWMPAFSDALIAKTDVPFYKAAALLLRAAVS